jgi:hypothetical protein
LFADVPGSGTSAVHPAKSGNPLHDTRSGKFGAGGGASQKPAPPPNVDPLEFQRMMAAVRDAAREFDQFDEGDVRDFLKGRAAAPDQVDVAGFLEMVKQQRINDLSDMLDSQFRTSGSMKQGRRKVRVTAPRGFVRKSLNGLSPDEVEQLKHLLVARGHDEQEVNDWFDKKKLGNVQLVDEYDGDGPMLAFADIVARMDQDRDGLIAAIREMPAPQITVNVPEPAPRKIKVNRGQNGLISSVRETTDARPDND